MNLEETTWAIRVKAYSKASYYEKALEYASNPETRYKICHVPAGSISECSWLILVCDNDFLMDEMDTKEEAIKLCLEMNWRLV